MEDAALSGDSAQAQGDIESIKSFYSRELPVYNTAAVLLKNGIGRY
jgi:hypothetical protein